MSFTDQKPRIATEDDCRGLWSGGKNGQYFRCYLCGHKFKPGDYWRWVCSTVYINFLVCGDCDGPDVHERWRSLHEEFNSDKFWALHPR
jgi:uncharacterized CHY-type Zn-finger protein